jgi:hypothetical protein
MNGYFIESHQIRHVDWERFFLFLDSNFKDIKAGGHEWDKILLRWLDVCATDLGPTYKISESNNFFFLSAETEHKSKEILVAAEKALNYINQIFSDLLIEEKWRRVIILFDDTERYLDYMEFYRGEHSISASATGVFLQGAGYQHIVLRPNDLFDLNLTVAHELTHYILAPYPIPLWLNEGLAVTVEKHFYGKKMFLSAENFRRHQELWTPENIEKFLSGEAFLQLDPELTYGLAEILVASLLELDKETFVRIIRNMSPEKGGAEVLKKELDVDLKEIIQDFLSQDLNSF